jgi:hypothetical protein
MTETEWLQSTDPVVLLDHLKGRLSDRKLRLLACACAWKQWPVITDERTRQAVYRAEHFADGEANPELLQRAFHEAHRAARDCRYYEDSRRLLWSHLWRSSPVTSRSVFREAQRGLAAACAEATTLPFAAVAARLAVETLVPDAATVASAAAQEVDLDDDVESLVPEAATAAWLPGRPPSDSTHEYCQANRQAVCALVRDVAGNPFRPAILQPSWLTWHNGWARQMARLMYGQRKFAELPIVADALEDAGCDNAEVLEHCRSGAEHVRGCWVVDLLLGRA